MHASAARRALEALAVRCAEFARVDFDFLHDENRSLFTIGYNVTERRRDAGFYDLLASEARLGVFVAIAQGKVAQESWFSLGRLLDLRGGTTGPAVVERLDVRIPDAAAGHAGVSGNAARGDIPLRRRQSDRVCAQQGCGLGHFGIRLQHDGCRAELSVSRVRCSRPRAAARSGAGARDRAVRERARADHPASRCREESAPAGGNSGWLTPFGFYEAIDYTSERVPHDQTMPSCARSWHTITA